MIDVKQAVRIASEYCVDLMGQRANGLLLEEVDLLEGRDGKLWKITVSFPAAGLTFATGKTRDYKVLTVDADSGEVHSMKILQL